MSRNSDKVKRWRQNIKKRIVESMGGKCCICGYDKCNQALDVHHLVPSEKEFGIGRIIARPVSWDRIVVELRKCILVCSNCHSEIHYDLINLDEIDLVRFNESFADKNSGRIKLENECPICGRMKNILQKTCSYSCAAKLSWSVDWSKVDLEKELRDGKSYSQIAEMLGCSNVTIAKRCRKLKIDHLNKHII